MYRLDIAIDCTLGASVGSALLNLVTVVLACRGVWLIRRYQNYTVLWQTQTTYQFRNHIATVLSLMSFINGVLRDLNSNIFHVICGLIWESWMFCYWRPGILGWKRPVATIMWYVLHIMWLSHECVVPCQPSRLSLDRYIEWEHSTLWPFPWVGGSCNHSPIHISYCMTYMWGALRMEVVWVIPSLVSVLVWCRMSIGIEAPTYIRQYIIATLARYHVPHGLSLHGTFPLNQGNPGNGMGTQNPGNRMGTQRLHHKRKGYMEDQPTPGHVKSARLERWGLSTELECLVDCHPPQFSLWYWNMITL